MDAEISSHDRGHDRRRPQGREKEQFRLPPPGPTCSTCPRGRRACNSSPWAIRATRPIPTGYGSVGYTYQMGKYDVTVGQYCQFLNAVAETDPYGLYNSDMATDYPTMSASPKAAVRAATATRSRAATAKPQLPGHSMSPGAMRPVLQLAAKRSAHRGRGAGHDGDRGVHAQRRDTTCYGDNPQRRGHLLHSRRKTSGTRRRITRAAGPTPATGSTRRKSNTAPSNVLSSTGTNNANYTNGNYTDLTNSTDARWVLCGIARSLRHVRYGRRRLAVERDGRFRFVADLA